MFDDSDNDDNEFDNLLKYTGGAEFFANVLGGIEKQENSMFGSESDSSSSSESSSSSDDSVSPLYNNSSSSDSGSEYDSNSGSESDSNGEDESPLFSISEDPVQIDEKIGEEILEDDESPLFEIVKEPKSGGEPPVTDKKTVADVKKLILDMSKLL
jgi:clumping factor A